MRRIEAMKRRPHLSSEPPIEAMINGLRCRQPAQQNLRYDAQLDRSYQQTLNDLRTSNRSAKETEHYAASEPEPTPSRHRQPIDRLSTAAVEAPASNEPDQAVTPVPKPI